MLRLAQWILLLSNHFKDMLYSKYYACNMHVMYMLLHAYMTVTHTVRMYATVICTPIFKFVLLKFAHVHKEIYEMVACELL